MSRPMMFPFGSGRLFFQAQTYVDASGTTHAASLDYFRFGRAALQEGGFNISMDIKELHGANRFPVDVRTGMGKIEGTAKYADWEADAIALILGVTASPGTSGAHTNKVAVNESGTVPSGSPYTITVANSATWVKNLEVTYLSDGSRLQQVASGATTGQYTVANGVYTFVVGDASAGVRISYMYTVTTGKFLTWSNVVIGTTPVVAGIFQGVHDADQMVLELKNIALYDLKTASKVDDWMHLETGMKAFADPATDQIGQINIVTS